LKGQIAGTDPEKEMRRMEALILSMTPKERAHPELIDGSRRKRIARGSGAQPADVNRLLKAREQMQKLAKQFGSASRKGTFPGLKGIFG
jgi:signal recognition particle subunit SRP54